jgi:DNA polymerase-3 subunit delta
MIAKSFLIENDNNFFLRNEKILFYGENIGLIDDLKIKIKKNFKTSIFINFYQEELINNTNKLINEMEHGSLFNEKKLIFIDNATDKILPLLETISEIKNENRLIITAKELDKKSKLRNFFEKSNSLQIIPCYPDNELSIKKILIDKLSGYEGLSNMNVKMIADNCGNDRVKLKNELNKIRTFFLNKKIETQKLELLLNIDVNEGFNSLRDEAIKGNRSLTNKLLSITLFETDRIIYYLNSVNQSFQKLLEISKNSKISVEDAINKIKPPVFWKDKPNLIIQSKKWTFLKINKILKNIYNTEIKLKSNSIINKDLLIKKLLLDICNLANS